MAQIYFGISAMPVQLGSLLDVGVFIDSHGQTISAIEGVLPVPVGFEMISIQDGGSVASLWVEKPHETEAGVVFAGITPGGFNGSRGQLFTMTLKAEKVGSFELQLADGRVLLNDGDGTAAVLNPAPLIFLVTDNVQSESVSPPTDLDPPEDFTPVIVDEPQLGGRVAIFSAVDKASGIDYYQLKEGQGEWQTVTSPYLLAKQTGPVKLQVIAVDHAGNERLVKSSAGSQLTSLQVALFCGILSVIIITLWAYKPWRLWLR